jgi:hypothetical protein
MVFCNGSITREWKLLSGDVRAYSACTMTVGARIVDRMDEQIGGVMKDLEVTSEPQRAVELLMSDSGVKGIVPGVAVESM